MKNSSILVPVILIVCLLLLALLISQAFTEAREVSPEAQSSSTYTNSGASVDSDSASFYDPSTARGGAADNRLSDLVLAEGPQNDDAAAAGGDRYLVIAGTFRQMINGRTRVRDLRQAGFGDTQLEKFDRGTYAVALVGRSATYQQAKAQAEEVRQAGYEVQIYTKKRR